MSTFCPFCQACSIALHRITLHCSLAARWMGLLVAFTSRGTRIPKSTVTSWAVSSLSFTALARTFAIPTYPPHKRARAHTFPSAAGYASTVCVCIDAACFEWPGRPMPCRFNSTPTSTNAYHSGVGTERSRQNPEWTTPS
ncbi:hypothetical protein LX32DRAFT_364532 [Colletotrichum zoysiae]|uniref:Secreted protein n=1 Tax=Colletotrichum zoysiae TaxID=1216348 RepID=A0AAD9HI37_9PEZI|nr:hypothetical protein LX32DRAFT_364532 [Colletotrichum zoysiae]